MTAQLKHVTIETTLRTSSKDLKILGFFAEVSKKKLFTEIHIQSCLSPKILKSTRNIITKRVFSRSHKIFQRIRRKKKKMGKNNSVDDCINILEELNAEMVDVYFPVITCLIFTMIAGGIGNCILAYVYYYKFEITSTQVFVVALAMNDFLTCIICIPMEMVILHFSFTFHSDIACRLIRYIVSTAIVISAYIICIISVDRYMRVCRSFQPQISVQKSKKIVAFLVIAAAITTIVIPFVYFKNKRMAKHCGNIGEVCSLSESSDLVIGYYIFLTGGSFSAFLMLFLIYALIGIRIGKIYKAKKNIIHKLYTSSTLTKSIYINSRFLEIPSPTRDERQSMHPVRTNFILSTISLIWIISYLPHFAAVFFRLSIKSFNETASHKENALYKYLLCSFYVSSALNPYVYGVFCQKFRTELNNLFRKIFHSDHK
ncbi:RYamide receptor [Octopus bimaculoides]|uniref:G-protein coupled receptors family 1 profile domain-containing protein n=1 Tax=Octopus bimaculoides TaxID=37653 RepID=A0A0L8HTN7_OCTBM|nr:RYamide receptor [Octopus bimaculoides]|eukprot:XP_014769524.1 PREDICTED: type-1 angiotensin II receptor B-like [Octopus bimaculoides]